MKFRIKFSADIYIKGESMNEIKTNFENFPIFSADALEDGCAEFSNILLVEDADTCEDLMEKYNQA